MLRSHIAECMICTLIYIRPPHRLDISCTRARLNQSMTAARNQETDSISARRRDIMTSDVKSHLQLALVALDRLSTPSSCPSAGREFLELEAANRAICHALITIDECMDVGVLQRAS